MNTDEIKPLQVREKLSIPQPKKRKQQPKKTQTKGIAMRVEELDSVLLALDDIEKLCAYLNVEMNKSRKMFTEDMANTFRKYAIDGYAFQMLDLSHIEEMEMNISIGQRLHLLSKAEKIKRAVRMKRRNRQLFKAKCILHCGDHSSEGTVTLTSSALKFTFVTEEVHETDTMPKNCCFALIGSSAKLHVHGLHRIVNHVDLSLIEDVDFQNIDIKKTTVLESIWCHNLICPPIIMDEGIKQNFIWLSLAVPEEIMSTNMGGEDTVSVLRVEIEKKEQAIMFKDKLVDAIEEVQFDEGKRY